VLVLLTFDSTRSQFVDAPLLADPIPRFGFRVEGVDNAGLAAGLCHFDITRRLGITSRRPFMRNDAVGDRGHARDIVSGLRIAIGLNRGKISNYRAEGQDNDNLRRPGFTADANRAAALAANPAETVTLGRRDAPAERHPIQSIPQNKCVG
jgi:hypothetical protein